MATGKWFSLDARAPSVTVDSAILTSLADV